MTERANQTIQRALRKNVDNASEWDKILPLATYASHESTGESPFYILHEFEPKISITDGKLEGAPYVIDFDDYKHEMTIAMKTCHKLVKIARTVKEME